jgi:hypothetical protein
MLNFIKNSPVVWVQLLAHEWMDRDDKNSNAFQNAPKNPCPFQESNLGCPPYRLAIPTQ